MHLQALHERQITKLVIGIAPGHAKSTIVSQMFPVWCWVNDPYSRWLCASHSLDLAIRDNRYRRRLIESEWFKTRYGHIFTFAPDQRVKGYYENDKKGYHMAVAVRGSGTGKRATHLLIDDANNAMAGAADIAATIEWYGKTWVSRQNDQENGPSIVVGQRLGANDLIGHILELGGCEHLCLPEEFEPTRRCFTKIGWTDPRKAEGELLWPERFPKRVLNKLKAELGPLDYAAQYQQSPVPAGGSVFKQEDERQFTQTEDAYLLETPNGIKVVLKSDCWNVGTVDLAISSKQSADYTAIGIWAITPARDVLLLHMLRGHWSHPEQQQKIKQLNQQFEPEYFYVENVAYQLAIIQDLLAEGILCREYKPTRDKVSRASSASVWHAAGKIYFLKNASWLATFLAELYLFPKAKNDDQVDNVSMVSDIVRARGPLSEYESDEEIPEAAEETGRLIPLTVPLKATPEEQEEALQVVRAARAPDPFRWVAERYGGDW
jgi:predicted phage terminase large subunit-like protein